MSASSPCDRCDHPPTDHRRDDRGRRRCRRPGCPCDGYWPRAGSGARADRPDPYLVAVRDLTTAVRDLTAITGQKPMVTKARKSIAQFKLREGMPIGAHVTLRGDRAWEFLDRLLSIALPRIRDFRGLSDKQFDGHGNYTFGLTEQSVFHEIDQDRIDRVRGMDITVVTTARAAIAREMIPKSTVVMLKSGNF